MGPQRPLRVGFLFDGSGLGYGVYEVTRSLLTTLDRSVVTVVGIFMGPGGERDALSTLCDAACDLGVGNLLPLSEPGRPKYEVRNLVRKGGRFLRATGVLRSVIHRTHLDMLHVHFFPLHLVAGLACRLTDTACIWHWHGAGAPSILRSLAWAGMPSLATRIACISQFVARSLPPSVRRKARVVYNGIDSAEIRAHQRPGALRAHLGVPDGTPLVAVFGSLTVYKGHEYFIRAAHAVLQQAPGVCFGIVGAEGEVQRRRYGREARLRALAAELGITDCVRFAGEIADARLVMSDCDIICMPTVPVGILGEGFGLVMVEAMAAGVPVIATTCGAPPEVIHDGINGLLVPPFDSQALAQAILHLLRDDNARRKIARAGQQHIVEHFDIKHTARAMEAVYRECWRGNGSSPGPSCRGAPQRQVRGGTVSSSTGLRTG